MRLEPSNNVKLWHSYSKQSNSTDIYFALIVEKLRNLVSLRHEDDRLRWTYIPIRPDKKKKKHTRKQVALVIWSAGLPPYLPHSLFRYWLNCKHLVSYWWQLHRHALLRTGHNLDLCRWYRRSVFYFVKEEGKPQQPLAPGANTCLEHWASAPPSHQTPAACLAHFLKCATHQHGTTRCFKSGAPPFHCVGAEPPMCVPVVTRPRTQIGAECRRGTERGGGGSGRRG